MVYLGKKKKKASTTEPPLWSSRQKRGAREVRGWSNLHRGWGVVGVCSGTSALGLGCEVCSSLFRQSFQLG